MTESTLSNIWFFSWFFIVITLFVLKLLYIINWPWLWVTAPIWGGILLFVCLKISKKKF